MFVDTGKGLSCLVAQDWQLHHFIGFLDCQTKTNFSFVGNRCEKTDVPTNVDIFIPYKEIHFGVGYTLQFYRL